MKLRPISTIRISFQLAAALATMLGAQAISAAQIYWDGGTVNIATDGNGISGGTSGNWDTTLTNWDAGASPHVAWVNGTNTAVLGGATGTVTLTAPITVGGLRFDTNNYTVAASTHGLTFGATDNIVVFGNYTSVTNAAAISGTITGAGNVILTNTLPSNSGVLTLNGTSAGGWSGTTTVNPGTTLALAASSQALLNTSGITLNGGNITLTNTTGSVIENDRVSGSTVTGNGGTVALANTSGAGVYAETIGSVALTSGQTNFVFNTNAAGAGSQTLTLGGLTRPGNTSAVTFSSASGLNTTKNMMVVTGATAITVGQIIAPWATNGNTASQTDYAVYNGSAQIVGAGITASLQTGWTTATDAYTADATPGTGLAGSFTLTGTRNITALKSISTSPAATADIATDVITQASHVLADGDAVVFNNGTLPTGLAISTPYFVRDAAAGSYKLAATPGGPAIDFTTSNGTGITAVGAILTSTGNNLGTTGILNASANSLYVAATGTGAVTLPSTTSGQLHVNAGAAPIFISAPVTDNGSGLLTLVKNGANPLTLSGNNTFTGGLVNNAGSTTLSGTNTFGTGGFTINGGTLSVTTATAWGGTNRNVTFGPGAGTLNNSVAYTGGTLNVAAGAQATVTTTVAAANLTFGTTTGAGTLIYSGNVTNSPFVSLGDASGFTGNLRLLFGGATNSRARIQFSKIADTAGSTLQYLVATTDGGQYQTYALSGNGGDLTFDNRQIEILQRTVSTHGVFRPIIENNNGNTNGKWVINTDLLYHQNYARQFELGGTNTQDNKFAGVISNGDGGGSLSLNKVGVGKWILSGNNTYSDTTTVSGGTLNIQHTNALGATSGNTSVADATTLQLQGGISFASEPLTMPATNTSTARLQSVSGDNTWNGPITITGASQFVRISSDADTLTLAGTITGSAGVGLALQGASGIAVTGQITGAGNVISGSVGAGPANIRTLSNATNNYTGSTSITGGTLVGIGANVFGSTTGINIAAIGTLSLRGDASTSFVKVSDSSPYTVSTTASDATINVDRATVAGTAAKTMSIGALGTSSTTATYQLNFTGANNTSLSAGILSTPISTIAATHTINNNIAGGGSLTLASVFNQATTVASPDLIFTGTGTTIVTGAITQTMADMDLIKNGAGTLTLAGTNTYTGATSVNAGTLSLGANNVLPDTTAISVGNATLNAVTFTDSTGTLDATGTATINLGAGAALAFADSNAIDWTGGSLAITGTFVSGASLRFGTTSSGLTPTQLGLITGIGTASLDANGFLVGTGGGNTYADWLAANPPATGFVTDSDNDGISNGVENVLGSNPNAYNAGLTQVSATPTSVIFKHTLNPTLASDVTYGYEWSTNMTEWKTSGQTTTGGTTATISASTPVLGVVTVTVTITDGPSAKLFGRLVAVK